MAATGTALIARWLKQPLILAYILAGLIIGPLGLRLIHSEAEISALSELGLAFLLFIVGLEIDIKKLVQSGKSAAIAGAIQVLLCSLLGFGLATVLGFAFLPALYLGVALSFSSTMIVVKLLADRRELDSVHGRLILGILLVQDVMAIVALAVQTNLSNPSPLPILLSIAKGLGIAGISLLMARYCLTPLFRSIAKTPEILLISAIAWCFLVSGLALQAGLSIAMGALLAGLSMSAFPYNVDVIAKIRSLRDFFITLFFVSLGMMLNVSSAHSVILALILSAFVILSRLVFLHPSICLLGYDNRIGILGGITLGQASEFSLVMASLGLSLGHINKEIVSLIALTLLITSTSTTYLVAFSHRIAQGSSRLLKKKGEKRGPENAKEIVILGFHRVASSLLAILPEHLKERVLVVDFSPEVHRQLIEQGINGVYADISHLDSLEHAGIEEAKIILSTVSDDFLRGTDNLLLIKKIRALNPDARIVTCAESASRAIEMYEAGAEEVILPRILAAEHLLGLLEGTLQEESVSTKDAVFLSERLEIVP